MSVATQPRIRRVKLRQRTDVAEGTTAFRFEKPPGFEFAAGQFLDWTLVDPPETDAEGSVRAFTIASSPAEDTLMLATRMRDTAFKRVLKGMSLGAEVQVEGPTGDLVLDETDRPVVFLAGGIGITPFRSMLVTAARAKSSRPMFLFYSNRRPEDAAFLDELEALARDVRSITVVATMTEMEKSQRPWSGETGLLDQAMLARHLRGVNAPIYYVAGPPGLVKGMQAMLTGAGIAGADVRAEEFDGY